METTLEIRTSPDRPFVMVPTYVNGEGPSEFLLDTGAGRPVLTTAFAERVGVKVEGTREARGVGGARLTAGLATAKRISVGAVDVEDVPVAVMDSLPKCVGNAGVLGYTFFKDLLITIDYPNHRLTLSPPEESRGREFSRAAAVPLRLAREDRPVLLADLPIDGRGVFTFLIDTGASQTIVSPRLASEIGLRGAVSGELAGAAGAVASSAGTLRSVALGRVAVKDIGVGIADVFGPLIDALGTEFDGILGYNVLGRFKIGFDYPGEMLYVAPSTTEPARRA